MSVNGLMAVKVLILIAAGSAFVWWQLRDLAREKKHQTEQDTKLDPGQNQPGH
ncbi:MAG: hypothetical protein HQ446_00010 [Polaromonas sp.]|nr:hypothetical protein [Polaromonas sp.]